MDIKDQITKISALTYDTELIGMRFYTEDGAYDADLQTLTRVGILNINIASSTPLKEVGDLLISEEEQEGLNVTDISEDEEQLQNLIRALAKDK